MPKKHASEIDSLKKYTGYRTLNSCAFYGPLAGLALTLIAITLFSTTIYFWPAQKDIFFILQLALATIGLIFISRIKHSVKTRLFTPLSQLDDWAQRMLNGDLNARIPHSEEIGRAHV